MTKIIFMIILLSITGPGAASVQKTIVVGPALVECTGVALQRCYRIKEDPDDAYSLYYDRIEGFEHQHGYEYQLLVEVITVDNPPADASSIRYRLTRAHSWKITSDRLELRDDKGSLQVRYSVRPQSGQISEEDQVALDLGCKVLAVKEALRNPGTPNALQAVTDVGLDQRYYTMVRGWLAYQLQGDMSILDAGREGAPERIRERVEFLKAAIRAIDLE
ncbi:MAG: DUF4377 domain-containing protein [Pseudomonadota bacterium]|nr:DUF4377 domain-containing protein [Pseudomonadota bacterium]